MMKIKGNGDMVILGVCTGEIPCYTYPEKKIKIKINQYMFPLRDILIHTNRNPQIKKKSLAIKYICDSSLDGTNIIFSLFFKLILHIPNKASDKCSGSVYS